MGEPFLVYGILNEKLFHQPLKEASLFNFRTGFGPYVVQRFLKAVTQTSPSLNAAAGALSVK